MVQKPTHRAPQTVAFAVVATSAPWLALSAYADLRAWRHWQAVFPFGHQGFCGSLSVAHCVWCAVAVIAFAQALVSVALAIPPKPRLAISPSKARR
jgi:hypothetical protein